LIINQEKTEELILAEEFIYNGNNDKALNVMTNLNEKKEHTLQDNVTCHLLKFELLFQQGLFEDLLKLAEQTYKESLGLGSNLLSVDALVWKALALTNLENVCWVCDVPIDYSKPVKKFKEEPKKIHIDKKHKTS